MKKTIVLFSGYNQRAVIAFLRSLVKNRIENYVIVASSEDDSIFLTDYSSKVLCTRHHKELNKEEIIWTLQKIKKQMSSSKLLLVPSTEALNRFLLENRIELEEFGCIVPLVDKALYIDISDKHSFWSICQKNGLTVPRINVDINECGFQFVAKPKKYFSNDGRVFSPVIVKNQQQSERFINNYNIEEFDIQEYVSGESYYLLFYISQNGDVIRYSQKNIAQQPNGKSILAACSASIHKAGISDLYVSLFRKIDFFGFIMVELRKKGNLFYMIEANPRLWGPSQFFVDSHVPIFEAFLHDFGIIDSIPYYEINQNAKYFWSGGVKGDLLTFESCVWHADGKKLFKENHLDYIKYDIYNRSDTKNIYDNESMKESN